MCGKIHTSVFLRSFHYNFIQTFKGIDILFALIIKLHFGTRIGRHNAKGDRLVKLQQIYVAILGRLPCSGEGRLMNRFLVAQDDGIYVQIPRNRTFTDRIDPQIEKAGL